MKAPLIFSQRIASYLSEIVFVVASNRKESSPLFPVSQRKSTFRLRHHLKIYGFATRENFSELFSAFVFENTSRHDETILEVIKSHCKREDPTHFSDLGLLQ